MNNLKKDVLNHLKEHNFNCVVKNSFPEIVAWRPFSDSAGNVLVVNARQEAGKKVSNKIVVPFFVTFITYREINLKERKDAKKCLMEGRCNSFFVASKGKKKINLKEIKIKENKVLTSIKLPTPSYLC